MATFATRLRIAAAEKNLNQSQLAKKSGVSQQHISRLWNGQSPPTREVVEKLARALEKEAEDLECFDEESLAAAC